jgi:hypothetical protein
MVNLAFSEKYDELFGTHFNGQMDEVALILKAHLLLEEMLRDFCTTMVPQPQYLKDARFTFAQTLELSRALYPPHVKLGSLVELWSVAAKINRVRNLMAHSLEPDQTKLDECKNAIIMVVRSRREENRSLDFAGVLAYVLGSFNFILQAAVVDKNGEDLRDIPRKPIN